MKHKRILSSLMVLGLSASGWAGQKKEDVLLSELRQIEAQLTELSALQSALKAAVDDLVAKQASQQDSVRKSVADSKVAIEQMQHDLSVLSERVDETNSRIGDLQEELMSMRQSEQPLVAPPVPANPTPGEPGNTGGTKPSGSEPTSPPPAVVAATPSVTDIYNQARIDYTQGRYPLAISGFKEVLGLDAKGDLADNAHYWMGESYLAQRQNQQALDEFDKIIRDFPGSNKRPDAYLKKAMTLEAMDRRSEANLMYELVIQQFPRTPQERVARRKLEELMKTTVKPQEF